MIFKNYEYFIAIAEEGSISKAAEKLYISQPSLSTYLKRLETNIGAKLFNRSSTPLSLTTEGKLYLDYVKDIARKEKQLLQDFSDAQNIESGTVSMAVTVWRSSIILPIVLPSFKEQYPHIDVIVYEGSHQYMASLFEKSKVDFAIYHMPNKYNTVVFDHIMYEKILFCVNERHPLLEELNIPKTDFPYEIMTNEQFKHFSLEPFIMLQSGQNIRDITQNYLSKQRISPKIILETSNIDTALNLVKAGLGVTFVPETMLSIPDHKQNLRFFCVDFPPLTWEIGIAYPPEVHLSRPAKLLMQHIKERYTSSYISDLS